MWVTGKSQAFYEAAKKMIDALHERVDPNKEVQVEVKHDESVGDVM